MTTTDRPTYLPATHDIYETIVDEITSLGGVVPDVYDDGERLFARAVLPADTEVRPGDHVRAGVAVRVTGSEILVHPYTFRQVCSNGAIAAHALATRRLERTPSSGVFVSTYEATVLLADFRTAVQGCASREAFAITAGEMRSATKIEADMALNLLSALAHIPGVMTTHWVSEILDSFASAGDDSAFGLMNAVTSVARTIRDPETRWRIEELGGTVPARLQPQPKTAPTAAAVVGA